jgi:hypothetical protein
VFAVKMRIPLRFAMIFSILALIGVGGYAYLDRQYRTRIFGRGQAAQLAYMARDEGALRALINAAQNPLSASAKEKMALEIMTGRLMRVPSGTKALDLGLRYFANGALVTPYRTTIGEMRRDSVVEVEHVRITDGDFRGMEGWAYSTALWHALVMP